MTATRIETADPRFTPRDYVLSWSIAALSFVTLFINYWFPPEQIFDEIYFARAAHEYLTRQYIYENTHPPITKLLITLSTLVIGNTSAGWRFLDVLFGAVAVWLLYALVKRMTASTPGAVIAAVLFACDGMHFVQSRIATPESFVVTFVLALIYVLYRYVQSEREAPSDVEPLPMRTAATGLVAVIAVAALFVRLRFPNESLPAQSLAFVWCAAGCYTFWRYRFRTPADRWLVAVAVGIGLVIASKWYGVMVCTVAAGVVAYVRPPNAARAFAMIVFVVGSVYTLAYLPQYFGLADLPTQAPRPYSWTDVVNLQIGAYQYHHNLVATHPYASAFWQWPLDLRPILYYAKYADAGHGLHTAAVIYSLPNPLILWPGLLAVPYVAFLAWRERRSAYALLVIVYLAQWLPWAFSPRIAFAYHFYVDIPLVCACLAIALERIPRREAAWVYVGIVVLSFAYFYPILSGTTIPDTWLQNRQWLHERWT